MVEWGRVGNGHVVALTEKVPVKQKKYINTRFLKIKEPA